ncbi:MAG: hypothetical protein ACMXX5_01340 [Candidatus Woesearchaeota archaeon]
MTNLIMYYGENCPHCHAMMPLVEKLEKEENIKIEKKEVWSNDKNADEMRDNSDAIMESCKSGLGVPAFFSLKTKDAMCGEWPYEELKRWALKNK